MPMKFTPAGGRVSVECAAVDDTVALSISDTGLGIAAEKLETIFEPFVQLKEGLADRKGGIGLGLSISRDLARAMNGDLTVESTEGKGARFTLSLPRASETPTVVELARSPCSGALQTHGLLLSEQEGALRFAVLRERLPVRFTTVTPRSMSVRPT
jgi:hypothetical protein